MSSGPGLTGPQCPCGTGRPYAACCLPLHRGEPAVTAEQLMRARYSAFVTGEAGYLFRSWHPRTRPADLTLPADRTWTGLRVLDTVDGGAGDATGIVEFEAHYTTAAGPDVQRERSRFERRGGVWVYVDGVATAERAR